MPATKRSIYLQQYVNKGKEGFHESTPSGFLIYLVFSHTCLLQGAIQNQGFRMIGRVQNSFLIQVLGRITGIGRPFQRYIRRDLWFPLF